jgi:preprotein translocase subunit SecB
MHKPLVVLEHYFFPIINVTANSSWQQDKHNVDPNINISTVCSEIDGHENTYAVKLDISIKNTDEHPSQYNVQLSAYGVLTADKDLDDKKNNMSVTGSSILYSASREFLLGIMSRGPWPPIMLRALPFHIPRPDTAPKSTPPSKKTMDAKKSP